MFRAWTTPELVRRWWGFDTSEWLVCDIDLREGGSWRYVTREPGTARRPRWASTVCSAVEAPHRLVSTEVYEGFPDAEALNTMVLDERDGVTTMTVTVLHSCQEHRDGHVASGMEGGMQISMNRLEDVVVDLDLVVVGIGLPASDV